MDDCKPGGLLRMLGKAYTFFPEFMIRSLNLAPALLAGMFGSTSLKWQAARTGIRLDAIAV